tara:strand:+ start:17253 stop:18872 length:1620 start_codon:yes stop_codon:yes gene_type:complete
MNDNTINVVLVDDDQDDYFLIQSLLNEVKGTKYNLSWVSDSTSGIESLKNQSADVYLVDYRIDYRTGLDILDEIKKYDVKKCIILLTGQGNRDVDVIAMNKGASDFLSKDQITPQLLERSIRYCIKRAIDQEKIEENQKLKSEKRAMESSSRAKSAFLANMSHEIRTPLSAILGFTDLALESNEPTEIKDFLKFIKRNGESALQLINDILDLSKIEADHIQIVEDFFDWRKLLSEIVQDLRSKYLSKPVSVSLEYDTGIPQFLKSDPLRVRQIVNNILGNAIKFTERGSIKILCLKKNVNDVPFFIIDVEDTGPGITLSNQEKLFHPFEQGDVSLSRKHGGTGLGLDLSKKLAQKLKGDVVLLKSQVDKGSTFRISLPYALTDYPSPENPTPVTQKPGCNKLNRNLKVLLVEDSFDNQKIINYFLKDSGFELETAWDGEDGVQKATNEIYDIILMDIQMPKLDGNEATRRLRRMGFTKPIIALTANAISSDLNQTPDKEFSAYLTKPVTRENLLKILNQFALAIQNSERQNDKKLDIMS